MTISRFLSVLSFMVAVNAGESSDDCGHPLAVNTERLVACLREVFHVPRGPSNGDNKAVTRRFVLDYFRNISVDANKTIIEEQRFRQSDQSGVNIIYVLPGAQWGTDRDNLLVVAANYDTALSVTPGVEDNGSGMVALLETARLLTARAQLCTPDTTIVFVAVDQLSRDVGFTYFGTEYLIEKVLRKYTIPPNHFRGVLVLKGLMNFDPAENSQSLPTAVYMLAPESANAIAARGSKGDFMAAVSLSPHGVGELVKSYRKHWAEVTSTMTGSRRPLLYDFELPMAMDLVKAFKEHVNAFANAGVFTFWTSLSNYTGDNFNIVALTDTVQLRGYMRKCYGQSCDNLAAALKPSNVELLRVTTTALVQYLANASRSISHVNAPTTATVTRNEPITGFVTVVASTTNGPTDTSTMAAGNLVNLCVMLSVWLLVYGYENC